MEDQLMTQLITTLQHAAEEIRSLRDHEWLVTYYALGAYAVLVVAPKWVGNGRTWANVFAFLLVVPVAWQAERVLYFTNDLRETEDARLQEAVEGLQVVCDIHQKHPPTMPWNRPFWVNPFGKRDFAQSSLRCGTLVRQDTDSGLPLRPGLGAAVLGGAVVASWIILSRIPGVQRFVPRIRQWVPGFFAWMSRWVLRLFGWMSRWVRGFFAWVSRWVLRLFGWMSRWVRGFFAWVSRWA